MPYINFKKLLLTGNLLIIFYYLFSSFVPWIIRSYDTGGYDTIFLKALIIRSFFFTAIYLINYFFIIPYIFKNGFTVKKFLSLLISFIIVYVFVVHFFNLWIQSLDIFKRIDWIKSFTHYVNVIQEGFFYFLFSTSMRVINMHVNNQLEINTLTSERKKIDLENMQTKIESELVSKYIDYLYKKNEYESISNEIVELSDFLRYSTYRNLEEKSPYQSELIELARFKNVLTKSKGAMIHVENDIITNPLIPVFSLLTPLKELLMKYPELKELNVRINKVQDSIKMIIKTEDISFKNLEFSQINVELNQLETKII